MGTPALTVKVKIKSKLKFYVLRLLLISLYLLYILAICSMEFY